MNRKQLIASLVFAAGSALCAATAFAADAPPPPEGVWLGKGQLGYVGTQGNTDSKSLNAALDMTEYNGPWKHAAHLGALYGSQAGITSANRWDLGWQSDYKVNARLFGFGALRYLDDKFGGFQYQGSATAGVGYKFVDTDTFKLAGQLGAGYRSAKPQAITKDTSGAVISRTYGSTQGDAIVTAGLDYWQALTKTTTLTDKLMVESGKDNTLITNALALTVKMSDKLALGVGYAIQDNTKAVAPVKKLDAIETVNLVYSF
jgi:putative salt-induced outer membrane protein